MSCNYYNGKCIFLNGKVYEDGCIACPIKRAYKKGFRDGYAKCITDNEERKESNRLFQKGGAKMKGGDKECMMN